MPSNMVTELSQLGIVTGMLATAIVYFYRRDVRNEKRNEEREQQIKSDCDKERADMLARIRQLEDRQHQMHESTLAQVGLALDLNTRALERFCDDHGSGFHKTIGDK